MKQQPLLLLILALVAFPAAASNGTASAPLPAAAPTASPASAAGGTDPKAVSVAAPAFPTGLKNPKHAKVVLEMRVLTDGRVDDVKVIQSGGEAAYDETATAAAKSWKFSPATDNDGKPVEATITVPVTFDPGTGPADIDAQLQKVLQRPCRQFTAELAAWRRQNPEDRLEDLPTFRASTGILYAMALTSPMNEMLRANRDFKTALPLIYARVVDECAAHPNAVYQNVWGAALEDAAKAPH